MFAPQEPQQPETGDRNVHVTAQDVTAALHEVG